MITNVAPNQSYVQLYTKPQTSAEKSEAETELINILNELQESQPPIGTGDMKRPYTLPVSGESFQERTEKLEDIFSEGLKEIMSERGISSDPPFELGTATDGHVYVKGDHPQKEEIEQIFEDNPELENLFRGISSNHSLMKALDTHIKFSEEYAINQIAAVMKYSYLFDGSNKINVSMVMDENGSISWETTQSNELSA
jgi:hypothetical protein